MQMLNLRGLLFVRHLGTIGRAAALALARVLRFAAVVAGLAAALALARVLALTRMLVLIGCISRLVLGCSRSLCPGEQIRSLNAGSGSREQARNRRASNQELIRLCHFSLRPPVIFDSTAALPADCPP